MLSTLGRIGLMAALFGLAFVPSVALAQDKRVRHVEDNAKLFSKDAVENANKVIAKIKEKHKKDLLIETVAEGPDKEKLAGWAKERFNNAGVDGVYVVLVRKPKGFAVDVGDQTLSQGYFLRSDIRDLENLLNKKGGDKELLSEIATSVLETMNERHKPKVVQPEKKKAAAPVDREQPVVHEAPQPRRESNMPPWVGWVCMIVAVLFVVWIIFAIIRAMTGAMGGGYGGGYGPGGYGYGGGGGGGFFTGMLGGLFGAMAGMWIYNNFFGGHAAYRNDGSVDWGGGQAGGGGADAYQGDADVGASGGGEGGEGEWGGGGGGDGGAADGGGDGGDGGDWGGKGGDGGGDWGGGDAGGGGGDWGGGGDAGGGDWGGGGGDFGGGGGDW